jgi:hypothetical protein
MTARILVSCDAVHPDRTPPVCRAYLATTEQFVDPAYEEAEAAGWTQTPDGDDHCPSCSRSAS